MVKYVYAIDYPIGHKRAYLEWVRSIADRLQAPAELKRIGSFENFFSASPQRTVEFEFDTLEDAARYFERPEIAHIFQSELPLHADRVAITVLKALSDYNKRG